MKDYDKIDFSKIRIKSNVTEYVVHPDKVNNHRLSDLDVFIYWRYL